MNPPLPKGYWGNGCVPMYAQIKAGELIEQPIWKTAELIKQSKSNTSDEYVRSFIDFQELHHKDGINAGTGKLYILRICFGNRWNTKVKVSCIFGFLVGIV